MQAYVNGPLSPCGPGTRNDSENLSSSQAAQKASSLNSKLDPSEKNLRTVPGQVVVSQLF